MATSAAVAESLYRLAPWLDMLHDVPRDRVAESLDIFDTQVPTAHQVLTKEGSYYAVVNGMDGIQAYFLNW